MQARRAHSGRVGGLAFRCTQGSLALFFFFQAEDGIRDVAVTGVQTCALPISGALLLVDNTFATPILQRPLSLGADVVLHSTTKYCGGHSDVQGGCLIVKSQELLDKLLHVREILGAVASPFGSWLILRGLRSLPCRMERHSANGRSEEHTSELQSRLHLVCRLLLEKK